MIHNKKPYEILIVDDAQESLELLRHILKEGGYRVRPTSNGRLALKSVAARLPDLILLDVKMPDMDGYEVCRRLKSSEQSRNVPVIFVSAYDKTVKKVEGFQAGGVDYIIKPFEREEVLARVASQLQLRKLTEHLEQEVNQQTSELTLTNQQLRQQIAERQQMEKELNRHRDQLEELVKERTAELEAAKNKAQQYLDVAGVILVAIDADRRVTLINQKGCEILGGTAEDIIGKDWFETFIPANMRRDVIQAFHRLMAGEIEPVKYFENPVLTKRGQERLIAWHNALLRDDEGNITGVLSSGEDITEQKRAEEQIKGLNRDLLNRTAALEAANKDLEAFAYSVSHDLRAPLRHIDGFMELLQKRAGKALDEKSHHYMDTIYDSAKKMELLIDDLLTFSRMERHAVSFDKVELDNLAREVISDLEPETAGRPIDWHISDIPPVEGDAAMLKIVITNLITNALKFTRPREKARIEIGSLPNQTSEAVIFVRDNGVGFDQAYTHKLFGVFQRLHRVDEFEGTGIGLANVRRIIARHGGRVWAEGKVDQGATFYVALPKA
jgi:PAS domain S-box-containing protein